MIYYIKMNSFANNFISAFEKENENEQNIIENEILNYLINKKNKNLFDEIKEFIINELNETIKLIDKFEELTKIIKKYGKNKITQFILLEIQDFEFYFKARKLNHSYNIDFEIKFHNFKYNYEDSGNIDSIDFGFDAFHYFTFNENINLDMENILEKLFYKSTITEECVGWLDKYETLL